MDKGSDILKDYPDFPADLYERIRLMEQELLNKVIEQTLQRKAINEDYKDFSMTVVPNMGCDYFLKYKGQVLGKVERRWHVGDNPDHPGIPKYTIDFIPSQSANSKHS